MKRKNKVSYIHFILNLKSFLNIFLNTYLDTNADADINKHQAKSESTEGMFLYVNVINSILILT
jgi:hypothetical protein